ncbi:hypothetical protein NS365_05605 [Aureimonas ureilytica]|uniref:Uncharacterized protein n=1 Tax=Aureimonas ureilytica TaxID=401562 RepID=A0A175RUB1_9HYPH|nr:hypothetical protein [Aureimonas ureilytica]KTR06908.1 hypothetical protein NS365_05605 [Aureimonas ureilytica]
MTIDQDSHGSYQITLPTGVDVVYHGDLDHPAFDVTIGQQTTRMVYGDASLVPAPYGSVDELREAISADPMVFAHEAVVHVVKWRRGQAANP